MLLYEIGHVPGAVKIDWHEDLQRRDMREFIDAAASRADVAGWASGHDTTVIFYGDKNNWWAAYAYWFFRYKGHKNLKIMNGGRKKWVDEGRELTRDEPSYPATQYTRRRAIRTIRAFRDEVLKHIGYRAAEDGRGQAAGRRALARRVLRRAAAHARLPAGRRAARRPHPRREEHPLGAGRRPRTAPSRRPTSCKELYGGQGHHAATRTSSPTAASASARRHTWFVLHELLGYPNVRNYDGSWTEWGNVIGVPIEK